MIKKELIVMEGESRPITEDNLLIIKSTPPSSVTVHVKGGLRHGRITVSSLASLMFSPGNVKSGNVVYHHDDSDALEDRIFFRITNGKHTSRTKVSVRVIPKDDDAPTLIVNEELNVRQGDFVQLTTEILDAHDKDSIVDDIIYLIKTRPIAGNIVKKNIVNTRGQDVSMFTQKELENGFIYYAHNGESGDVDLFEFKLVDKQEPPNRSSKYTVPITIHPSSDLPLQAGPKTRSKLLIHETDLVILNRENLFYQDTESSPSQIIYTISSQPFYLTTTITIDAGRIVHITDNDTVSYNKHSHLPAVHRFTQADVNADRIAYVPPSQDIGPIRRHARFIYAVKDSNGNKILNHFFDITLLPVNNRIPHMIVNKINVLESGSAYISTNEVSGYDPDTDQSMLAFVIDTLPKHGTLWDDEEQLGIGSEFSITNLMQPTIR